MSVLTYGAIILARVTELRAFKYFVGSHSVVEVSAVGHRMCSLLLVQGFWTKSSWGFPKGKVNENEPPYDCACREVLEETGFDITKLIDRNEYLENHFNDQLSRLYIVPGVPLDTKFKPKTRKEIKLLRMSHNSKYYVKKLSKKDGKGLQKIGDVFKQINKVNKVTDESRSSEIKSEVEQALEYIIKEVCNETNDSNHGNVDNVNNQSTIEKVSTPTALSETSTASVSVCESPVDTVKVDQRKFSSKKYEHKYTWLYCSHSKNGFMCKICELFALSSSSTRTFVFKGVILGTHPTRQLESHAKSVRHLSFVETYSFSKSNVNVSRLLRVQDTKAKDQNRSVVKKRFQCVDFLIKQNWAASKTRKS
ncbi:DCP2 [Mytilus edulis]|uniref:mRNA-decapping enzyme 2 n=1 Tax=Mytilus edulis TaxID=6550 RepID=A0A8S3R6I1_MYTED|nr:DCP2 [Mytilus edulis]